MGNECPECETVVDGCRARDVFKQQSKNREDLDISHIRKGQYRKVASKPLPESPFLNSQLKLNVLDDSLLAQSIVVANERPYQTKEKDSTKYEERFNRLSEKRAQSSAKKVEMSRQVRKPLSMVNVVNQTIQLKPGLRYVGGTTQNIPNERGKAIWEDGTTLTGTFFLGQLAQGQTISMQLPDEIKYEGEVVAGKREGVGKLIFGDGSFYEGEWKEDKPNGQGRHKMSDNSFYEGDFRVGKKWGRGKYYFSQGMYEGQFVEDKFEGEGILALNDGRVYKGKWRAGHLQGKGEQQFEGGQKYIGDFVQSMREGEGTYYYGDGREWSGEWKRNKQNGFGKYVVNGQVIKGIWQDGVKKEDLKLSLQKQAG